jgi:hypothetical protein
MAIHHLKTWPSYFQAIKRGEKPLRGPPQRSRLQPGDTLILQEWKPCKGEGVYTGDWLAFKAGWIVYGGAEEFGADAISPLYCVIGLASPSSGLRRPSSHWHRRRRASPRRGAPPRPAWRPPNEHPRDA